MADEFTDHTRAELELLAKNEAGSDTLENIDRHIRATLVKIDHDAKRAARLESALILVIKQLSEELNEETPGWWGELIDMCKEALYGER